MSSKFISLADAQRRLGKGVVVVLEPNDVLQTKTKAGTAEQLWVFDPSTGRVQRGDGKFHALGVVQHPGGWNLAAVIEEPSIEPPKEGPHIIGHVIVDVNEAGFIKVRTNMCLNGEILEVAPSSLSKGELDGSDREPDALVEANPQRIVGTMAVFRNDVNFADDDGMCPHKFVMQSTDSRSIAAVAKLGLLN